MHQLGPARPACAHGHAQVRIMAAHHGRIVAGTRPYRARGPGSVAGSAAVSQRPCRTPRVFQPVPQRPAPCAPAPARPARLLRAQRRIVGAVPRAPAPCRGRVSTQAWPYRGLPRDTLPSLKLPFLSQYIVLFCNAIPAKPDCCNTIYCIAIQPTLCPPKATLPRYT